MATAVTPHSRQATTPRPTLFLACALGGHTWKLGFTTGAAQRPRERRMPAGAVQGLGFLGGVYVDQWYRRKTMLTVDRMRCGVVIMLPIASLLGPISRWHLATATTVLGGHSALFDPALQDSLPMVANNTHTVIQ